MASLLYTQTRKLIESLHFHIDAVSAVAVCKPNKQENKKVK